jgi:hypothetical protein
MPGLGVRRVTDGAGGQKRNIRNAVIPTQAHSCKITRPLVKTDCRQTLGF